MMRSDTTRGRIDSAETKRATAQAGIPVTFHTPPHRSGLGLSNQSCKPEGGHFLPTTPEDSIEQLMADMAAEPEGRAAIQRVLDDEAEDFLRVCVACAKRIQLMEDPWAARRIMVDVTIWATELKRRLDKEVTVNRTPTDTSSAFER